MPVRELHFSPREQAVVDVLGRMPLAALSGAALCRGATLRGVERAAVRAAVLAANVARSAGRERH